jgi:hypothetical protein
VQHHQPRPHTTAHATTNKPTGVHGRSPMTVWQRHEGSRLSHHSSEGR